MKPYLEERNKKIRGEYAREFMRLTRSGIKKGDATEQILEMLVKRYQVFNLALDTIRQIIFNPNYGREVIYGIQILKNGDDPVWLLLASGAVAGFTKKESAQAALKDHITGLPKANRPKKISVEIIPQEFDQTKIEVFPE